MAFWLQQPPEAPAPQMGPSVPDAPLQIQLPNNALRKAAADSTGAWAPAAQVGHLVREASRSWLQPGSARDQ